MDQPVRLFKTVKSWETWLAKNHDKSDGIWIRFAKKKSELKSINYTQALDVALCYGWIDSQLKKYDDDSYIQRFTPRRKRSMWSKVNREKVRKLIEDGRMQPAGQAQIDAAKADGRWDAAYDPASTATVPDDLQKALNRNRKAKAAFEKLDRNRRYSLIFKVQTAVKPETRERRIAAIIDVLGQ